MEFCDVFSSIHEMAIVFIDTIAWLCLHKICTRSRWPDFQQIPTRSHPSLELLTVDN